MTPRLTPERPTETELYNIRFKSENEPLELRPRDVAKLLAEIDALRGELTSLTNKWAAVCDDNLKIYEIQRERDRLRGEVKALEILQTCKSEDVLAAFGANNNLTRERDTLLAELDALRGELEHYRTLHDQDAVIVDMKERDTLRECLAVAESGLKLARVYSECYEELILMLNDAEAKIEGIRGGAL